jgi:cysteine dioxygenase
MRGRRQILDLFRRWDDREQKIPLDELTEALAALAINAGDVAEAVCFDDRSYMRTVIHGRDHYQALLLCWRSGQSSPIHDHRGSNCAVRIVAGRATETRFSTSPCGRIAPVASHVHPAGCVTGCSGDDIHQMANLERIGTELVTLHVYSPPPSSWRTFRVCDTTLADDDRLIRRPARTVRVELGHAPPNRPLGPKTKGGMSWRPSPAHELPK